MSTADAHRAIDTVWRMESPRLIAGLVRMLRDVDLAEELAQDALVAALERWPRQGVPDNPGAWLMATAKHRAIDRLRRSTLLRRKHEAIAIEREADAMDQPDIADTLDDEIGDDLLRLIFIACHPVLSTDARVALTLRLLGGLATDEIARAFLVPEPTIAQRIVRAKRTLSKAQPSFDAPRRDQLGERVDAVLEVIYLVFNEGYGASVGDDLMRPALCAEALRLGRVLVALMPRDGEAHGLLALMELQSSRTAARVDDRGEPVLLLDQDRARWDRLSIRRGLDALARADALSGAGGPYALQAAIAACHASALRAQDTDWSRIAGVYATLQAVAPSPVVELNRAVAVAMHEGPTAGLALIDALAASHALDGYHLMYCARADLLEKLGRRADAARDFDHAATLTRNARERGLLQARAIVCRG